MKLIRLIVILFIAILGISFITYAVSNAQEKPLIVNGHIYGSDGRTKLVNATVKVTCNEMVRFTKTNLRGFYVTEFLQGCRPGHLVVVESNHVKGYAYVQESEFFKNTIYINLKVQEIIKGNDGFSEKPKNSDLKIKSLILEQDNVDDKLVAYIRVQNQGSMDESNVKIRLTVDSLDINEVKTISILSKDDIKLRVFEIDIPKNSERGYYSLEVEVLNSYSKESESIEFKKI